MLSTLLVVVLIVLFWRVFALIALVGIGIFLYASIAVIASAAVVLGLLVLIT